MWWTSGYLDWGVQRNRRVAMSSPATPHAATISRSSPANPEPGEYGLYAASRACWKGRTGKTLATFAWVAGPVLRSPDPALTPRELEVLALVGRGLANGEIASQLHISEVTVKAHLGHILTKLGLRDRAAVIVYAFDTGLVSPGG